MRAGASRRSSSDNDRRAVSCARTLGRFASRAAWISSCCRSFAAHFCGLSPAALRTAPPVFSWRPLSLDFQSGLARPSAAYCPPHRLPFQAADFPGSAGSPAASPPTPTGRCYSEGNVSFARLETGEERREQNQAGETDACCHSGRGATKAFVSISEARASREPRHLRQGDTALLLRSCRSVLKYAGLMHRNRPC